MIPLKDNIPGAGFPLITVLLIALNVAIFLWQLSLPTDRASTPELAAAGVSERDQASIEHGAIPFRITHPGSECGVTPEGVVCGSGGRIEAGPRAGRPLPANLDEPPWWQTLFSSMFMHAGFLHIAGNMLFLWIFGNNVEGSMGRARFLLFYLLAGLVAVYAQALLDPSATGPTIGASGAVAGVLGAYALLFPRARVLTIVLVIFFATLIEIPALVMLAAWFLLQFIPAVGQLAAQEVGGGAGIAYLAHVGGFLFGLGVAAAFKRALRDGREDLPGI